MSHTTDEQRRELQRLAELTDEDSDTSELPEIGDLTGAVRGPFYRPYQQQIDPLESFRSRGGEYQTRIDDALRE